MQSANPELILASGSMARRQMLSAAGLEFEVVPADVDEDAHRGPLAAGDPDGAPQRVAAGLARLKAEAVSRLRPTALVIGADQVLAVDADILSKAPDRAAARAVLRRLAGRSHALHSAACLARGGRADWQALDAARLQMREFTADFLERYLDAAGDAICSSVGAYQLEGLGIQLFDRIEGDYFTILGLPLLPLLAELRSRGVLAN